MNFSEYNIEMVYVYADSTNRDTTLYPSGNSFTLHLTTPIQQIVAVDLVSAKVPNSFYNLTSGSNVFQINSTLFSLSPGFYSACGLAKSVTDSTGKSHVTEFVADQGKFIISSVGAFTFEPLTSEIQNLLGMTASVHTAVLGSSIPEYTNDPYYATRYIVKSDRVIDLSTNEFVFLDIDELRSVQMVDSKSLVSETYAGTTIRSTFGMIPMDVSSGTIKHFKEQTDYRLRITFDTPLSKISRLTIRWIDKDGQMLNFQGFDNTAFVLRFEVNEPKEPPPEPEPNLTELEVKRLVESMLPPPMPAPKRKIPRIFLYLVIMALLGMGIKVVFFKNNVTVQ